MIDPSPLDEKYMRHMAELGALLSLEPRQVITLLDELDRLREENARLRGRPAAVLDYVRAELDQDELETAMGALQAENARLSAIEAALPRCSKPPRCIRTATHEDRKAFYCDEHVPSVDWEGTELPYTNAVRGLGER
jgi:hypothetical protein